MYDVMAWAGLGVDCWRLAGEIGVLSVFSLCSLHVEGYSSL